MEQIKKLKEIKETECSILQENWQKIVKTDNIKTFVRKKISN